MKGSLSLSPLASGLQDLLRQLKPEDESAQQALHLRLLEMESQRQAFEEKRKEFEKSQVQAQKSVIPDESSFTINLSEQTSMNLFDRRADDMKAYRLAADLAENTSLTVLDLSQCILSDFAAYCLGEALDRNSTLLKLTVYCEAPIGWYFLSCELAVSTSLSVLNLVLVNQYAFFRHDPFSALCLAAMLENSKNAGVLSILNLRGSRIDDEGAAAVALALKEDSPLRSVNMGACNLGFDGIAKIAQALSGNNTLTTLRVDYNDLGRGVEMFSSFGGLIELILYASHIDDSGVCALSRVLEKNTVLTSLDLGQNYFTEQGVRALVAALAINTTLTSLDLNSNNLGKLPSKPQAPADFETFFDQEDLSDFKTSFYQEDLWMCIQGSLSLLSINLGDNEFGEKGAQALAQVLSVNTVLTNCDFVWNNIGDPGMAVLAIALEENNSLKQLSVNWNAIGDAGINDLVLSLRQNTGLKKLGLRHNPFTESGVEALLSLSMFKEKAQTPINTTLTSVDLFIQNLPLEKSERMSLFL